MYGCWTGFEERRIELEDAVLAGDSGNATSPEWEAMLLEDPVFRRTAVALVFEPRLPSHRNRRRPLGSHY